MSKADYDRLTAQGLEVETVADLIGGREPPPEPVIPPRLEGQPEWPGEGIFFGMPEEEYHAIHACSYSGIKRLSVSNTDYWASSPLNPDIAEDKEDDFGKAPNEAFFDLGKAYHKRIVEGCEAFAETHAVGIEKEDFDPKLLLVTTDQIKFRIAELGQKPCSKGYDDLSRSAKKEDWVAQLLDLQPDALIWDVLVARHAAQNEGKAMVSARQWRRIEIAARMIENDPELSKVFSGGWPEVSAFWHCPETGCPMKMRADYLKMRTIVDKKTFSTRGGLPVDRAIEQTIASMKYNVQDVVYNEGAMAMRKLIRQSGEGVIHGTAEQIEWALKWARQDIDLRFLLVMQKTGAAPVTRGKIMPRGTVFSVTRSAVLRLKRRWVECARTYDTDMWLDLAPIEEIADEELPLRCTEL